MKIKVYVSTRYQGSLVEDEIEIHIPDDASDEEKEAAKEECAREWVFDQIDWGWKNID